jgi:hypothetical protein
VEFFSDLCVSEKESENRELLRRLRGRPEAAERLGGGRLRSPPGRGLAGRSSFDGGGRVMLGARSVAMLGVRLGFLAYVICLVRRQTVHCEASPDGRRGGSSMNIVPW